MFDTVSLFPAEERLEQIAAVQRGMNAAFAQMCRLLVGLHTDAPERDVEFVGDQVALLLQVSPMTGRNLVGLALSAAALPGLLEAVEADLLTERHVRAVLDELQKVPLSEMQQAAVVAVVLSRLGGQTPGELGRLIRRTVLLIDVHAAEHRRQARVPERRVEFRAGTDGEACVVATGPLAQIAAVRACLEATLSEAEYGDERTTDQRLFDLFVDLLTGGTHGPEHWEVAVLVPYTTTQGGDLELAEMPGLGAVLPSTARDLLSQAGSVRRIAIDDQDGHVLAVEDRRPVAVEPGAVTATRTTRVCLDTGEILDGSAAFVACLDTDQAPEQDEEPLPETVAQVVQQLVDGPVELHDLSTANYRIPGRLRRFVQAGDRRCVFPGCPRDARGCDLDHRQPWPAGSTDSHNLQALCRRHHRAKHAAFDVIRLPDGTYRWRHRLSRRWFDRPPEGY